MRRFGVLVEGGYCVKTIGVVRGIFMEMLATVFVLGREIRGPACYTLGRDVWVEWYRSEGGVDLNRLREWEGSGHSNLRPRLWRGPWGRTKRFRRVVSGRSSFEPAVTGKQLGEGRRSRGHRGSDRGILLGSVGRGGL